MVVIRRPSALARLIWQAACASPSTSTMQAPQSPTPQPYLVPVRFIASRRAHSNGVCGSMRRSTA